MLILFSLLVPTQVRFFKIDLKHSFRDITFRRMRKTGEKMNVHSPDLNTINIIKGHDKRCFFKQLINSVNTMLICIHLSLKKPAKVK